MNFGVQVTMATYADHSPLERQVRCAERGLLRIAVRRVPRAGWIMDRIRPPDSQIQLTMRWIFRRWRVLPLG